MQQIAPFIRALGLALSLSAWASFAWGAGLIRDAEIERTLKFIARPILQKAGLGNNVKLFIVNDRSLNAFVAGGNNIFVHSGLIQRLKTVEMLQSVIAHEAGHITGGHLSQRAIGIGNASTAAGLGLLLGIAAAAAGNGQAGAAIASISSEAARRNLFAFTRSQEASADQSGVRFMAAAGINPQAAVDVLDLFRGQEALSITRQDAYARTHPLSSQRIANLRGAVAAYKDKPSQQVKGVAYWHARMVAKFNGFIGSPSSTLRKLKKNDTGEIATLTRAIAYHRLPKPKRALKEVNKLLNMRPKDPYYHELKGQFLLETGNAGAAVKSYQNAARLAPKEPLIQAGLGQSLLALNTKSANKQALSVLEKARARDPRDARMLRDLALAYARNGNNGMASVVTAERYALRSNFKQAKIHATRAEKLLPRGTNGWLRAQDILSVAKKLK